MMMMEPTLPSQQLPGRRKSATMRVSAATQPHATLTSAHHRGVREAPKFGSDRLAHLTPVVRRGWSSLPHGLGTRSSPTYT
mmetsp:Transcript_11985/g.22457  ORF Transcript_11985/g.22457 Transcript_11985/m.22457 type:complete len:81 (-) Transcript_11985:868-1110(-)